MPSTLRRRAVAIAKLLLGVALVGLLLRWLSPDLSALRERAELDVGLLVAAFACTVAATFVTSLRWKVMVEAMGGTRLPYAVYFHGLAMIKVIGQFTSTLATDLVGRGLALRSAGSARGVGHAMTQAIVERLFDLLLPGVLLVWALAIHAAPPSDAAVVGSFAGILLLFAVLAALILWPLARVALRLYLAIAGWRGTTIDDETRAELLAPPISRTVAAQVGVLSVLRYLTVLGQYWAIAAALGLVIDFRAIASATPLGQLAGIIGVTPGALGIQEAGWAGAFRWLGVLDDPSIGLFVISQRVLVFAFFALIAAVAWPWLRRAKAASAPNKT
jgi:uncharacterized membrane protein YbhN (UPF0104 family)